MRRYLFAAAAGVIVLLLLSVFVQFSKAAASPGGTRAVLLGLQDSAGDALAGLTPGGQARAERFLAIADRRIAALASADGIEDELFMAARADQALDRSLVAAANAPAGAAPALMPQLSEVSSAYEAALQQSIFLQVRQPALFRRLVGKLITLRLLLVDDSTPLAYVGRVAGIRAAFPPEVATRPEAFGKPSGSYLQSSLVHSRFALLGAHAGADCAACHTAEAKTPGLGRLVDLPAAPSRCADCHASDKPAGHAQDACATCHAPFDWRKAAFDHEEGGPADCRSCHLEDQPQAMHERADCASCHNARSWESPGRTRVRPVIAQPPIAANPPQSTPTPSAGRGRQPSQERDASPRTPDRP